MAQAAADLSEAVPYDSLQPFQDHFHPVVPKQDEIHNRQGLDERRTGNPMTAISAIPLQYQVSYFLFFSSSSFNFSQGDRAPGPGLLGLLPAQAFRPESDRSREMYQVGLIQTSLLSLADHYILHS